MISITTTTYDPNGNVILHELPSSDLGSRSARVSRVATLDGGSVITHSGTTHGDRTFKIEARITEADEAVLNHIYENHTFIHISTKEGFFSGTIESLNTSNGDLKMVVLIKEKLN